MRPESMVDMIDAVAAEVRASLHQLMAKSRITHRFENSGPYMVVVSGKPFRWEPLDPADRPLQLNLRRTYAKLEALVACVSREQPIAVREKLADRHATFRNVIDQDDATTFQTPDENCNRALKALSSVLNIVRERADGDPGDTLLIPDTNALYAQPALENWSFCDVAKFTIVIVPAVVSEIDRHKDSHSNPDVKGKAQRLVRQLKEYRRRGNLADGVTLRAGSAAIRTWAIDPNMETALPWLKADSPDDRLIASALEIGSYWSRCPFAIVTRDINMETKCDTARVPCLDIDLESEPHPKGGSE